jgi:hypothetical protein
MNKLSSVFVFVVVTLFSCQKQVTVNLLSEKEPLALSDRVVFLEDNQPLPESAVKVGELTFNKATSKASDEFYNSMISAKKIARESGANVVKSLQTADSTNIGSPLKLMMYKYSGDVVELIKRQPVEEVVDSLYSYVFLKSCSLTTSSSSRQWCTQLSIRTALLQNYTYPEIRDSSTFEDGDVYELSFDINAKGQVIGAAVKGSNEVLSGAIVSSLEAAKLSFNALKSLSDSTTLTCTMNVGSYEFLTLVRGEDAGSPQAPMEATENQMLFSVRKATNK